MLSLCVSIACLAGAAQATEGSILELPDYGPRGEMRPQRTKKAAAEWAAMKVVEGRKRALIVSMDYPGTETQLVSSRESQRRMQNFVKDTLKFKDRNIKCLNDSTTDVTLGLIEREVAWLKKDVRAGDVMFFYFTGHGGSDGGLSLSNDVTLYNLKELLSKDVPKGVTIVVALDCCHAGTIMKLRYELNSETNKWIIPSQQPKRSENGPVIVAFTACRKDETSQRDDRYFTEAFINEITKKDEIHKRKSKDLLNSFRAVKHKVRRHRSGEAMPPFNPKVGDLVETMCLTDLGPESPPLDYVPATIIIKEQGSDAYYVRFEGTTKYAHREAELLRALPELNSAPNSDKYWEDVHGVSLGTNWVDLHDKKGIHVLDQGVHKQTACCQSNSSRLDLSKLTIHKLANGICDRGTARIKEKYLRSESSLSATDFKNVVLTREPRTGETLMSAVKKQLAVAFLNHLLEKTTTMTRPELEALARVHLKGLPCSGCDGKGILRKFDVLTSILKDQIRQLESQKRTQDMNRRLAKLIKKRTKSERLRPSHLCETCQGTGEITVTYIEAYASRSNEDKLRSLLKERLLEKLQKLPAQHVTSDVAEAIRSMPVFKNLPDEVRATILLAAAGEKKEGSTGSLRRRLVRSQIAGGVM